MCHSGIRVELESFSGRNFRLLQCHLRVAAEQAADVARAAAERARLAEALWRGPERRQPQWAREWPAELERLFELAPMTDPAIGRR